MQKAFPEVGNLHGPIGLDVGSNIFLSIAKVFAMSMHLHVKSDGQSVVLANIAPNFMSRHPKPFPHSALFEHSTHTPATGVGAGVGTAAQSLLTVQ